MDGFFLRRVIYLLSLGLLFLAMGLVTLLSYDPKTYEYPEHPFIGIWWSLYIPILGTIAIGFWWVIYALVDVIKFLLRRFR